jgi:hypothetical protein
MEEKRMAIKKPVKPVKKGANPKAKEIKAEKRSSLSAVEFIKLRN